MCETAIVVGFLWLFFTLGVAMLSMSTVVVMVWWDVTLGWD